MTTDTDRPLEALLRGAEHTETNFRFDIPLDDTMIRRHTALCATAIREAQHALQRVILISELPAALRKAIDFLTSATIEAEHVEAMLRQKDITEQAITEARGID